MSELTKQIIKSLISIIMVIIAFVIIDNAELFWGIFLMLWAHNIATHKDN